VIDLHRLDGRVLRIGHRGAAALAPENTLPSFRAAVAAGVDLIEFDVLDLPRGPLVLAHSDHLDEVSHGAASGRVRDRTLEELREVAPGLPTLDEALAFFVEEAPHVGLHIDLKLRARLDELGAAIERHGLSSRTVVSGTHRPS
jgi:glycerophosphoryl diester phosphodiesterase